MTHTPTPWHVEIIPGSYKRPAMIMSGERLVASCVGDQLEPSATSIGEATANAEFIVRAVNEHNDLVKALEGMLRHSCVADSAPEDKDADDIEAEYMAGAALRRARQS